MASHVLSDGLVGTYLIPSTSKYELKNGYSILFFNDLKLLFET